jgi:hypothetical protein
VAVAPATVTVGNTTNVHDGTTVAVHIVANPGSKIFGFEIRLCAGGATIRLDSDMRPTLGGNCVTKALSSGSDFDQIIQTSPPNASADTVFRVGVGSDHFSTNLGRPVNITCGPGHPCELALKIQYPGGFAFRTIPVTYA